MLTLVPFNDAWIDHSKLDLKAIYRRPRWTKDEFDQDVPETGPDGLPLWDLTTPLPVKQHNKWKEKGFEYVTLADRNSLIEAYRKGALHGSPRDFDQHQTGGPWNAKMYMAGQSETDNAALLQLRADIERFGSDAVESIRRQVDPKFTLPTNLQDIEPGGALPPLTAPKPPPKAAAPATTGAASPRLGRRRKSTATTKKEPVSA